MLGFCAVFEVSTYKRTNNLVGLLQFFTILTLSHSSIDTSGGLGWWFALFGFLSASGRSPVCPQHSLGAATESKHSSHSVVVDLGVVDRDDC